MPMLAPSKGALRLLYRLAWFSSFGAVAGSMAVITKERHRRICIARKMAENARKIKASRRYRNTWADRDLNDVAKNWQPVDNGVREIRHPFSMAEIDKAYEAASFGNQAGASRPGRLGKRSSKKPQAAVDQKPAPVLPIRSSREGQRAAIHLNHAPPAREIPYPLAWGPTFLRLPNRTTQAIKPDRVSLPSVKVPPPLSPETKPKTFVTGTSEVSQGGPLHRFSPGSSWNRPVASPWGRLKSPSALLSPSGDARSQGQGTLAISQADGLTNTPGILSREIDSWSQLPSQSYTPHPLSELVEHRQTGNMDVGDAHAPSALAEIPPEQTDLPTLHAQEDPTVTEIPSNSKEPEGMPNVRKRKIGNKKVETGDICHRAKKPKPDDELGDHSSTKALSECQLLLTRSDPSSAVAVFLQAFPRDKSEIFGTVTLSSKVFRVAHQIVQAAASRHRWAEVDRMYEWAKGLGVLASLPSIVQDCIVGCSEQGDHKGVQKLYLQHQPEVALSPKALLLCCKAYATVGRVQISADHILSILPFLSDEAHKLECENYLAFLLRRCSHETKKFDTVWSLFQEVRARATSLGDSVSLFNEVLAARAMFEDGNVTEEELLDTVKQLSMSLNHHTFARLMVSRALKGDWTGVATILDFLHDSNLIPTDSYRCGQLFNPVLAEYCWHHDAEAVTRFVDNAILHYNIVPNQITLDLVLKAMVKERKVALIEPWLTQLHLQGHRDVVINAHTVVNLLKRYYLDTRLDAVTLYRLCESITQHNQTLSSKELFRLVQEAVSFDRLNKLSDYGMDSARQQVATMERALVARVDSAPALQSTPGTSFSMADATFRQTQTLANEMRSAISARDPQRALGIYQQAVKQGISFRTFLTELAVDASIQIHGAFSPVTMDIITTARVRGEDVSGALGRVYQRNLKHAPVFSQNDVRALRTTVMKGYEMLEKHRIPHNHYLLVTAMNHLVNCGRVREAISLFNDVFHSPMRTRPLSIIPMDVLARAYGRLRDLNGVKWVIETVVKEGMWVSCQFVRTIRKIRMAFRKSLTAKDTRLASCRSTGRESRERWIELLNHLYDTIRTYRVEQKKSDQELGRELLRLFAHLTRLEKPQLITCGKECVTAREQKLKEVMVMKKVAFGVRRNRMRHRRSLGRRDQDGRGAPEGTVRIRKIKLTAAGECSQRP